MEWGSQKWTDVKCNQFDKYDKAPLSLFPPSNHKPTIVFTLELQFQEFKQPTKCLLFVSCILMSLWLNNNQYSQNRLLNPHVHVINNRKLMKELCKYYPHSWMKLSTYESQVTYLENSESINTCKAVCQIWSRKTAQQWLHENIHHCLQNLSPLKIVLAVFN